jgi:hypothetical protein
MYGCGQLQVFEAQHYHGRMWSATSLRGAAYRGWQERLAREIVVVGLQVPRRTLTSYFMVTPA